MTAELTTYQPTTTLTEQMDFARAIASGSLLPAEYRGNPANVLIAVGLGASMGLSPAESLYRISVIKGKPSAGAELIAANVRKAGHKLRVRGDETTCTATIVRADDPDYEFSVTRDLAWARQMGLASNDNYKKQPGTMLQWRAITAVARLACPEALYGVTYTPDELRESEPAAAPIAKAGTDALRAAVAEPDPAVDDASVDAEVVDADEWPNDLTDATRKRMFAVFNQHGIKDRDEQLKGIRGVIGREIASRSELTEDEARQVITSVEAYYATQDAGAEA